MKFEKAEIKVGGNKYHVRELTVRERRDIYAKHKEEQDATMLSVNMVLAGCNEFEGKTADEVLDLPGTVFDAISVAVANVSGMGESSDEGDEKND